MTIMKINGIIFPDMMKERYFHASVSMGNKLYVIGGFNNTTCEVFDSFSRNFTSFHAPVLKTLKPLKYEADCIATKILVFCMQWNNSETKVFIYDTINES